MAKLVWRMGPVFLLAVAPALLAAAPVSMRPAAVAVGADYSAPRKTVAAFLTAVQSTDAAAIKNAIVVAPEDQKIADTIVALWVAQAKLRDAAQAKFGDPATQYFGTVSAQIESRMKALESAPLKIVGDSAILTIPGDEAAKQSGGTVVLKKIGDSWKLDAATLFNLSSASRETTARRVALAEKLVAVTDGITADIAAGKFPSAGEAYQEFWNRSLAAAKEIDATTQAATKPR